LPKIRLGVGFQRVTLLPGVAVFGLINRAATSAFEKLERKLHGMKSDEMKPGDLRTFQRGTGNAVVLAIGIWTARQGKQIHIHMTGNKKQHTTVTNDPASKRYHRTLFRNLRNVLIENKCWPFGDEGAETESDEE